MVIYITTTLVNQSTTVTKIQGFADLRLGRTVEPMVVDEDGELMQKYARGDVRAFEKLYQRYRGPLYRDLARHTRQAERPNDLFQETWSKVIAKSRPLRTPSEVQHVSVPHRAQLFHRSLSAHRSASRERPAR